MKAIEIPVWKKSNLTIQEAAAYFNIGEHKLREMVSDEFYDCALRNGTKILIKRRKLLEALEDCLVIWLDKMRIGKKKLQKGIREMEKPRYN